MNWNIALLGWETSLGKKFCADAVNAGHVVSCFDISDQGNYRRKIDDLVGIKRDITHVVNCHGTNCLDVIGETPYIRPDGADRPHYFTNSMLVNNVAPIYWFINDMIALERPAARVLSIASQTYRVAQTNTALYCASKAALVQMSKAMARELAQHGWVINCLAPGKIEDTEMAVKTDNQVLDLRGWNPEEAESYALRNVPMRRFTTTAEVAEAMFKILDLPSYINGTCIDMTGGA